MLRSVMSVSAVVLLACIAGLLYWNHQSPEKCVERLKDLSGVGTPPPATPKTVASPTPPAPVPEVAPPAPQPKVAVQPEFKKPAMAEAPHGKRTHVVQPGESLWSISKTYYGTPDNYNALAAANGLQAKGGKIRAGQVLVLPDLPAIAAPEASGDNDSALAPAPRAEEEPSEPMPPTLSSARPKE